MLTFYLCLAFIQTRNAKSPSKKTYCKTHLSNITHIFKLITYVDYSYGLKQKCFSQDKEYKKSLQKTGKKSEKQ